MARKLRIEYAGAMYHVINRGNYRSWIFETEGARESFLKCLVEACSAKGWHLHAWVLMQNHYHLCIQTPEPNLVDGMKWLQSTFANRFNRYRQANGHVFQGRYKAILLDGDALGPVCHYIHLNPVRAGLVAASELEKYADSSFHQLWYPAKRWSFLKSSTALTEAGGLADTPKGRRSYRDYLEWLSEEDAEKKRLGFAQMCRGWAKGSKEFKKAVLEDFNNPEEKRIVESEAAEVREPAWETALVAGLASLKRDKEELRASAKGADWKVALARSLRKKHLAPHRWIAENLHMGTPSYVQSLVSLHRSGGGCKHWKTLEKHEKLD